MDHTAGTFGSAHAAGDAALLVDHSMLVLDADRSRRAGFFTDSAADAAGAAGLSRFFCRSPARAEGLDRVLGRNEADQLLRADFDAFPAADAFFLVD